MVASRISHFCSRLVTPEDLAVLRVQVPLVLTASLLLSFGYAAQRHVRQIALEENMRILLVGWDGLAWFVWVLAAPVMLILIRRFPLVRGGLKRSLAGLLIGSAALYALVSHLRFLIRLLPNLWLPPEADLPLDWQNYVVTSLVLLPLDFLTYGGFFATSFAVDYYFKNRHRGEESARLKVHAAQLESDLAQAELKALRGQLHPHFLFNSFNAVTTLMRQRRNESAVEVLAQLSALLRLAIERTGKQELSLEEEMDFIRRYLQIEWIRFGEKLLLQFAVDANALDGGVPNLVLQPLVENAIKHGISRRSAPGTVRVSAQRRGNQLELEVENDGPDSGTGGALPDKVRGAGIGLANTRARLEKIYGTDYRLEMIHRADGGVRVRLTLPWRPMMRT